MGCLRFAVTARLNSFSQLSSSVSSSCCWPGALFDPARYLDESRQVKVLDGREEGHMAFGFGRWICPGRYVAESTLAIDIATLLWAMRFERPEGTRGELDVRLFVRGGFTAYVVLCLLPLWVRTYWLVH
jgi:hypothetical protein